MQVYQSIQLHSEADYEIKKSRFFALGGPVNHIPDIKELIDLSRQRHPKAGHHCWCYQIGAPGSLTQDSSDDGEPKGTAGKPMLAILQGAGLGDCGVVVARYFGGVKLGTGGLVRAYGESVRQWLAQTVTHEVVPQCQFQVRFPYSLAGQVEGWQREWGVRVMAEQFTDCISQTWSADLDRQITIQQAVETREHLGLIFVPTPN